MKSIQSPRGVRDILPPETARWRKLGDIFATNCRLAGYGELLSPIFEESSVFARLGETTEVISKETYDFEDRDGKLMTLRPELTASAVRAFVQHSPVLPWKIWYMGPQFRHERPQAGRYRQFTQIGVEVLGADDPLCDVEVIALGWNFLTALGLHNKTLLINCLGDRQGRVAYTKELAGYWESRLGDLSEQSQITAKRNPLRVLDSKRPEDQQVIVGAPVCLDYLSPQTAENFQAVKEGLEQLEVPYEIQPRLVRGLDYYTHTAFEYTSGVLAGTQNALGGGGRYSGLVESLGGGDVPGTGFALGVDRILLACDAEEVFATPVESPEVFVADITGGRDALELTHELRRAGVSADWSWGGRSLKAQMKVADRSGARYVLIVGEDEKSRGEVALKHLRSDVPQKLLPRAGVVDEVRNLLVVG